MADLDWALAAADGEWELVQEALGAEEDGVEAVDEKGRTAAHYAAAQGALEMLEWLAARGADLRRKDKDNRAPLHRAMRPGKGERPSREAAALLLRLAYSPVERLVYGEAQSSADFEGFTAELADADAAELGRSFPELDGCTLAHLTAERGHVRELRWLAERLPLGPLRDREGNSLVHATVGSETLYEDPKLCCETLAALAALGCDVAAVNDAGQAPAHVAAEAQPTGEHAEKVLRKLAELGASLAATDGDGCDAAMLLAQQRGPGPWLAWVRGECTDGAKSLEGRTVDDYLARFDAESSDSGGEFGEDQRSTDDEGEESGGEEESDLPTVPE